MISRAQQGNDRFLPTKDEEGHCCAPRPQRTYCMLTVMVAQKKDRHLKKEVNEFVHIFLHRFTFYFW